MIWPQIAMTAEISVPFTSVISWACLGIYCGAVAGLWVHYSLSQTPLHWWVWSLSCLLTSVLFALLMWRWGADDRLAPYSCLTAVVVPLSIIDLAERRLPTTIIVTGFATFGVTVIVLAFFHDSYGDLVRCALGTVVLVALYLGLAVGIGGLGAGDVKLGGLLGAALAWHSWTALLAGTFLGWLFALGGWLTTARARRRRGDEVMPLGPYLVLGALLTLLGDQT